MRARLLNDLADRTGRKFAFSFEERERYVSAWARVEKHRTAPEACTREELNSFNDDARLLTSCCQCGAKATGNVHPPGDEEFLVPVCLKCVEEMEVPK